MDSKGTTNTKEDIRRMMRQTAARMQQSHGAGASSTAATGITGSCMSNIEGADASVKGHPFARYNTLNQLTCILCGCPVRSSLLWRTHLASKQHRANAEALKARGGDRAVDILSGAGLKRRLESAQQKLQEQRQQQQGGLGLAYSDEEESEGNEVAQLTPQSKMKRPSDVPAMALTGRVRRQPEASTQPQKQSRPEKEQQLPEGFFDDPVADARARNVPYRDKMEEELELFAREMRETQAESEQLAEAAEEEADNVRYLEEIIAQEETWSRLNELEILKETAAVKQEAGALVKAEPAGGGGDGNEAAEDSDDEAGEDSFNWRRKKL